MEMATVTKAPTYANIDTTKLKVSNDTKLKVSKDNKSYIHFVAGG
jgi:hypothetical protein